MSKRVAIVSYKVIIHSRGKIIDNYYIDQIFKVKNVSICLMAYLPKFIISKYMTRVPESCLSPIRIQNRISKIFSGDRPYASGVSGVA
jgi:hypothetical protein